MSKISNLLARTVLLWAYVGIGPMIGAGPLDARPVRRPRTRAPEPIPQQDRACGVAALPGLVPNGASTSVGIPNTHPAVRPRVH
jgi:hypothetical protein